MAPLNYSHRIAVVLAAVALALGVTLSVAQGTAASTIRVSESGGVTIKITPVAMLPGELLFAVVLDTQSAPLDDNLQTQAMLHADAEQLKPSQWDGTPPGAQHRDGILSFAAPKSESAALEIRIKRNGEAAPRVFRWERPDLK